MNKRELTKAKRLLRDVSSRVEVFSFDRTTLGRKTHSYGLSVEFFGGATRLYYSLDTVERDISFGSYHITCDSVSNMGFAHSYFPTRMDAENAVRDAETLLNRKLDYSINRVACPANTDYKAWNESGVN